MKRQPTKWNKIFANHISIGGQYPKYIRNSYNPIAKIKQNKTKPNTLI